MFRLRLVLVGSLCAAACSEGASSEGTGGGAPGSSSGGIASSQGGASNPVARGGTAGLGEAGSVVGGTSSGEPRAGTANTGGSIASGGASSVGGSSTTGGAVSTGGVTSTGGTSTLTGGAPSTGGVSSATGGAGANAGGTGGAVASGPLFPAPGSTGQCPDPSLRLRFDKPPTLGKSGSVRVFDTANPAQAVAQVNLATSEITDKIGGSEFKLPRPAFVDGNEAIFVLPSKGLEYGHTYYVTVDDGAVRGPDGKAVVIDDPDEWRFSVAAAAPSDKSKLQVALDGTGQFCSVQGAVDAAATGATISIEPGAYYGVVYFKGKDGLSLIGADRNTTRILGVNNNNLNGSTRGRALFGTENTNGLRIENVTIHNQTPQGGSQAEALALLSCDQCIVQNSTIRSLQDTLLWQGRIYAKDLLIEGNVDYIWGTGTVYFEQVEVKTVGRKGYNLQARNSNTNYGYVFVDSKLTSDPGITGDVFARIDVSAYPASHVAFIDCEVGPHISPEGWLVTGSGSTSNLRFWEYRSRSPNGNLVDTSRRLAASRQLSATEAAQMRDVSVVLRGWDPR